MRQNREPLPPKSTLLWSTYFWQRCQEFTFLINNFGDTEYPQKTKIGPLFHTIYKYKLKMD